MEKKRKIVAVVNKYNFKEAEEAENKYWAGKSPEYRLKAMMEMRAMTYENLEDGSMIREVTKRKRYAED